MSQFHKTKRGNETSNLGRIPSIVAIYTLTKTKSSSPENRRTPMLGPKRKTRKYSNHPFFRCFLALSFREGDVLNRSLDHLRTLPPKKTSVPHRIHGTGIFTYIYHKNQPKVGKYTIITWILWVPSNAIFPEPSNKSHETTHGSQTPPTGAPCGLTSPPHPRCDFPNKLVKAME